MKTHEEGYALGWADAIYAYESKQRKNMSTVGDLIALHDKAAAAWHANQSSRVVAAYDDGLERKELRAAIESALKASGQAGYERGRSERDALRAATALCDKHPPLGARSQCVICSGEKLQAALSQISYLCEEPNEMGVSTYDIYYDEDAVVEQVRKKLGKSPT